MQHTTAVALVVVSSLALSTFALSPAPGPAQALYTRPTNADCVPSAETIPVSTGSVNYFPRTYQIAGDSLVANDQITVTVAKDFSVQYFDNYKVVTNSLVNETYVLYQCGTPAPAANALPSGAKLFQIPLTSVSAPETVPLAFLSELGVIDRVQSVSSFAVEACGQKLLACGKVAVTDTGLSNSTLLATEVDPFVDGLVSSAAYPDPRIFAFSASMDPGVLNRAEWFKFLGMFFNLDAVATNIFNNINESYYDTKASIEVAAEPPLMIFSDYYDYYDETAYEISLAEYKVQYTQDAGAVAPNMTDLLAIPGTTLSPNDPTNSTVWFAWNSTGGGFSTQQEATAAFHSFLQGVDIFVDETYAVDPTTYNLSTFTQNFGITSNTSFPFLTNKQVFREDGLVSPAPNYGLDWYETAIARPDLVLLDFARAVNPTEFANHEPVWIRNIATGENVTITASENCNAIESCSEAPVPICPLVKTCGNGGIAEQLSANSTCTYVPCSS